MTTMADIARRAVPYGLATVDLHKILVNFALDPSSPEYKGPVNAVHHAPGLADPSDRTVVGMNVDTPYSYAWLDLRDGPVLLHMPAHEPDRYMSAQICDLYSYIVGYVSPRTTGSAGGTFLVRGPSGGEAPAEIDGVFDCPTHLAIIWFRTQLFDDADLPAVDALRHRIEVTPLGSPPPLPPTVPTVDVREPLDLGFLRSLEWMLDYMPALPEDAAMREDITGLGLRIGLFDSVTAEPVVAAEIVEGLGLGALDVQVRCASVRSSAEIFGSREFFHGDNLSRAAGAYLGILGNAAEEYLGVGYRGDENGDPFAGSRRYAITFAPDALPPVGAFWSITVYDAEQHLVANPIHRYVLGSRQLGSMPRAEDGSVTILVQHESPGPELESSWLPCPSGPFGLTFRTYLPGEEIRNGSWTAPPVRVVA